MEASFWMNKLKTLESPDASFHGATPPLVFSKASGSKVYDTQGHPYIDLCAGFGVLALGHNSPEFLQVCQEQISQLPIDHAMGDVYASDTKIELLGALMDLLPDHIEKGALALSGAGANEIALKTCLLHRPHGKIMTFQGSYHGLDLGVLPLVSRKDFKDPFQSWLPQDRVVELPYFPSLNQIEALFSEHEFSGVFIEPVQGRAGIRPFPQEWLQGLRDLCSRWDVLLVYDEVFTGLGRVGTVSTSFKVPADLICLGKSLGGGLPLSACCGTDAAFSLWPENTGESIHTGTFFGHPFSCRAGLAFLKAFTSQDLCQRAVDLGRFTKATLTQAIGDHPRVKSIEAYGFMVGISFQEKAAGARMMDILRGDGVIALASGTYGEALSLTPALNIPEDLLEDGLKIIINAVLNKL